MKHYTSIVIAFILITGHSFAQKEKYFSFELGGSGGIASINYEKSIKLKETFKIYLRTGFSTMPVDPNNGIVLIFPVMLHGVIGETAHKLDIGLGQSFSITTKLQPYIILPASIGYRFQPKEKKYYLRFAYTPLISYIFGIQVQHWAGITLGTKLKMKK